MRIRFRQSGGVAGVAKVAEIDSAQVPPQERERLMPLVEQALSAASQRALSGRPDEEQYYIEIEVRRARHTILVSRSCVPDELRPLVDYLAAQARYEKRARRRDQPK